MAKYKNPRKPNIVSMRVSDDEMESMRQFMELTNKSASELMRNAFTLLRTRWENSGMPSVENEGSTCS